jgi:AraC family transcriptional regulator of adaptative response/methylated-DNA-[protein]-cysteine methyltransferase
MLNHEQCWRAIRQRDDSQNSRFFFGVLTTGIYCRPGCPARLPLRKNVKFFQTPFEAERYGLRPCLRCRPKAAVGEDPNAGRIQGICRYIETHSEGVLKLDDLAKQARLSRFHFQRSFKAVVGLTPKQFLEATRLKKLKNSLKTSKNVTDAVYDVGFGSSSRVYERVDTRLGMTPKQYRGGGHGVTITYAALETPIGLIMVGATDRGLCFLQFGDTREELLQSLRREYPQAEVEPMSDPCSPDFQKWAEALARHLAGAQPHLDLPIDIRATAFQMRVWRYLQTIPYGEVQSYSEVAAGIGHPKATRAVARACGSNVVALVIPCHRVIRNNGELGGYRWGLDRKQSLIDGERLVKANAG